MASCQKSNTNLYSVYVRYASDIRRYASCGEMNLIYAGAMRQAIFKTWLCGELLAVTLLHWGLGMGE